MLSSADAHESIPSKEVCDALVESYMRTFGRLYKITHIHEYREQLSRFWNDPKPAPKVIIPRLHSFLSSQLPRDRPEQRLTSTLP